MAGRFKPGDLVRVLRSNNFPQFVGKVGQVLSPALPMWNPEDGEYVGYCTDFHPRFGPKDEQLEPVADDGRKTVEWEDCLWQPEGEIA